MGFEEESLSKRQRCEPWDLPCRAIDLDSKKVQTIADHSTTNQKKNLINTRFYRKSLKFLKNLSVIDIRLTRADGKG